MKKKLAIVIGILLVIAAVLVNAYYSNNSNPVTSNANTAPKTMTFDENSLINRGVTAQQLSNLEQVLKQFIASQNQTPGRVDFNNINRAPPNPQQTTPFSEITFVVQLDGKPAYNAKMDSFSTSEIRLYLYSLDGKTLLYDSQNVGGSSS